MPNQLFNMFGKAAPLMGNQNPSVANAMNLINKIKQLQNNPGQILDELAQSGRISQNQYNDLQQYRNNPQQIVNYLMRNGNANQQQQLNSIQQIANQLHNQHR